LCSDTSTLTVPWYMQSTFRLFQTRYFTSLTWPDKFNYDQKATV